MCVNIFKKTLKKYFVALLNGCVRFGTLPARLRVKNGESFDFLIDNTVLGYSVVHETVWIKTGWDEELKTEEGYLARIPVYSDKDDTKLYKSIKYLPGIYDLAKSESIKIYTSRELFDERLTQPIGRYRGNGLFDYSLAKGVPIEYLKDSNYSFSFSGNSDDIKRDRKVRLGAVEDPLYVGLVNVLGKSNSQDAYHIYIAEKNNLYCFLTMDFKLIRAINSQKGNPIIKDLRTKILSPEEFGKELSLPFFHSRHFIFHDKSAFAVRPDLNWEDSKRYKPKNGVERYFEKE